ncbi:MAG TPA: PAS domain S-box protein, partial [Desulfuromonadales bacterium]|nr:PAS domain S-box protein [Desulfuromonadales bacterium]
MTEKRADETPGISRRQLSWFLFFRVLVTSLFLGGAIFYQLQAGKGQPKAVLPALYLLVGFSYLQTLISAVVLPGFRRTALFIQAQIAWDLLLAAALIYVTGNIESLFSFLFILIIINASVFLTRREVLFVASAAAILYGSLLDLQYYGILPELDGLHFSRTFDGREVFYAVFINVSAFFLTALLSGTLAERLRRSQKALKEKEIDYEGLEKFSEAILANITSGLLIVDHAGQIRSFNTGASRITGYSLEDVYDRNIQDLFPGLDIIAGGEFKIVSRGEGEVKDSQGNPMVLG